MARRSVEPLYQNTTRPSKCAALISVPLTCAGQSVQRLQAKPCAGVFISEAQPRGSNQRTAGVTIRGAVFRRWCNRDGVLTSGFLWSFASLAVTLDTCSWPILLLGGLALRPSGRPLRAVGGAHVPRHWQRMREAPVALRALEILREGACTLATDSLGSRVSVRCDEAITDARQQTSYLFGQPSLCVGDLPLLRFERPLVSAEFFQRTEEPVGHGLGVPFRLE
jgi:hypothetical protein